MASMCEAFEAIDHDPPGLLHRLHHHRCDRPCRSQGHKDNLCRIDDADADGKVAGVAEPYGRVHEWEKFEGLSQDASSLEAFLKDAPFNLRRPSTG